MRSRSKSGIPCITAVAHGYSEHSAQFCDTQVRRGPLHLELESLPPRYIEVATWTILGFSSITRSQRDIDSIDRSANGPNSNRRWDSIDPSGLPVRNDRIQLRVRATSESGHYNMRLPQKAIYHQPCIDRHLEFVSIF